MIAYNKTRVYVVDFKNKQVIRTHDVTNKWEVKGPGHTELLKCEKCGGLTDESEPEYTSCICSALDNQWGME